MSKASWEIRHHHELLLLLLLLKLLLVIRKERRDPASYLVLPDELLLRHHGCHLLLLLLHNHLLLQRLPFFVSIRRIMRAGRTVGASSVPLSQVYRKASISSANDTNNMKQNANSQNSDVQQVDFHNARWGHRYRYRQRYKHCRSSTTIYDMGRDYTLSEPNLVLYLNHT